MYKTFLVDNLPSEKATLLKDFLLKNGIDFRQEDAAHEINLGANGKGDNHTFTVSWVLSRQVNVKGKTEEDALKKVCRMGLPLTGEYIEDSFDVHGYDMEEVS